MLRIGAIVCRVGIRVRLRVQSCACLNQRAALHCMCCAHNRSKGERAHPSEATLPVAAESGAFLEKRHGLQCMLSSGLVDCSTRFGLAASLIVIIDLVLYLAGILTCS